MLQILSIILISILMPRIGKGYSSSRTKHINATGKNAQLRIIKELNRNQKNGWEGIQWSQDKYKYHELQLMKLFAAYRGNEDKPTHETLLNITEPAVKKRKINFDVEYRIFGDENGRVQSNGNQGDDDYKRFCCGQKTGDNWIACDKHVAPSCKEWYHQKCVECVGSKEEFATKRFICIACRRHRGSRKRKR
eukprot:183652_1